MGERVNKAVRGRILNRVMNPVRRHLSVSVDAWSATGVEAARWPTNVLLRSRLMPVVDRARSATAIWHQRVSAMFADRYADPPS